MSNKYFIIMAIVLMAIFFHLQPLVGQEYENQKQLIQITLKDGSTLKGNIVQQDSLTISFVTVGGVKIDLPKSSIASIHQVHGYVEAGTFYRTDPNYSRLLYGPTGRPLKQGDGYFSDVYVFFPSIAVGISNNFSFMAGMSIIPGGSFAEQVKYIAPRLGIQSSDNFAFSVGALYASFGGDFSAGIAFAVATFGQPHKSFTAGIGLGYTKVEDEDFQFAEHPIIMLGGNIRLSNKTAFISENWLITGTDFKLSQQPFGLAIRFFGENLAVDFGMILIGEVLQEGLPIPWLSFAYNFGKD